MRTTYEIVVFAVKIFGTFGYVAASVRAALILWPHGWHLSSAAIVGAGVVLSIVWGWYK